MYHQQIPRDRRENLEWRIRLNERCRDKSFRKEVQLACKQDPLFYINAFCHLQEPRRGLTYPFCTWPHQDEAVTKIVDFFFKSLRGRHRRKNFAVEKSRDMGATWIFCAIIKWLTDTHKDMHFLLVSWKEDMVWCPGNMDALFSKIAFLKEHEPEWLFPGSKMKELHYENEDTKSATDGAATSERTGIGGRYTAMFIDEFSRIREDKELFDGTAACSDCRFFNYTPLGTGNKAYDLSQQVARGDADGIRMHWTEHPLKAEGLFRIDEETEKPEFLSRLKDGTFEVVNERPAIYPDDYLFNNPFIKKGKVRSMWYDDECRELDYNKSAIAQMIDIDYDGSNYGFFDMQPSIHELIKRHCRKPLVAGELAFDPDSLEANGFLRLDRGPVLLWCPLDARNRPPLDRRYVFAADVSMGIGETNSVLSGLDCKTGEKVLELATPFVSPDRFADLCIAILKWFTVPGLTGPKLIWDDPGAGELFAKQIRARGYTNIYYRQNEKSDSKKQTDTPGWYPTEGNKQVVFGSYRAGLASGAVINRSEEALRECLSIIVSNQGSIVHKRVHRADDPTCAKTNHGDRPTADALAYKLFVDQGGAKLNSGPAGEPPRNSLAGRRAEMERRRVDDETWS